MVIACSRNIDLEERIRRVAETLETRAHELFENEFGEQEFYDSGIFRGAVERLRGQFAATMREKRIFVQNILNFLQDNGAIAEWQSSGSENRHDYTVILNSGRVSVIELKGCLDGNNTNIFERPPNANEFVVWSVCTNAGADPRHNVWSGIHTRLSAEIISRSQPIDGLIVWDMICGTTGRPCPKLSDQANSRVTRVGTYQLPPPCIYLFPNTVPNARVNPSPIPQNITNVEILECMARLFRVTEDEIYKVRFYVDYYGRDIVRTTEVYKNDILLKRSRPTAIRRA